MLPPKSDELFEMMLYKPGVLAGCLSVEDGFLDVRRSPDFFQDLTRADFAISKDVAKVENAE